MHGISTSQYLASVSLLKRVRLMAEFIHERHAAEFEAYWRDRFRGMAQPQEALNFFRHAGFPSTYYLMRMEKPSEKDNPRDSGNGPSGRNGSSTGRRKPRG